MDAPFDAVVADDVEAVDRFTRRQTGYALSGWRGEVGNLPSIHYAGGFHRGFVADEEAADYLDAVIFLQFEFAGGGYFVVGGEGGYGLLEEAELLIADFGVGGAGTGALPVAPGEVAYLGEEGSDVGEFGMEEDNAVDEGALLDHYLLADGAGDFFAGVEELRLGDTVVEELEAAAELCEAYAGAQGEGVPAGRIVEENATDGR